MITVTVNQLARLLTTSVIPTDYRSLIAVDMQMHRRIWQATSKNSASLEHAHNAT